MKRNDEKVENAKIVVCPHCGARMRVPTIVIQSNVNDWPCVRCHRRFAPR
jgi:hypothetical protein